eukprot:22743-Eustigmatos_ZCMA.PRE.1
MSVSASSATVKASIENVLQSVTGLYHNVSVTHSSTSSGLTQTWDVLFQDYPGPIDAMAID